MKRRIQGELTEAKRARVEVEKAKDELKHAEKCHKEHQEETTRICKRAWADGSILRSQPVIQAAYQRLADLNGVIDDKRDDLDIAEQQKRFWDVMDRFIVQGDCHRPCVQKHREIIYHSLCFHHAPEVPCKSPFPLLQIECPGCTNEASTVRLTISRLPAKGYGDAFVLDTGRIRTPTHCMTNHGATNFPVLCISGLCANCSTCISVIKLVRASFDTSSGDYRNAPGQPKNDHVCVTSDVLRRTECGGWYDRRIPLFIANHLLGL